MIEIREMSVLRGPNIWAREPVIRLLVEFGALAGQSLGQFPGLSDQLLAVLPAMAGDEPADRPASDIQESARLGDGMLIPEVLRRIAVVAQGPTGVTVIGCGVRPTLRPGLIDVIYGYEQAEVGSRAGAFAVRLLGLLISGAEPGFDARRALEELSQLAERVAIGPSTQAIATAARDRGIPVLRLDPDRSLVQLGQGRYQRRSWTTITSGTSDLGAKIALDKCLTNRTLREIGLPAPRCAAVSDIEVAVREAAAIGYPVVVKPRDGNHGRGVCVDLPDEAAVREAFPVARAASRDGAALVEAYVPGRDYRIVVVNDAVVAVAERVPAHVVGDGRRTVRALVDATNADPRRGAGHERSLTRITVDDGALALLEVQGLKLDAVPVDGQMVSLKRTANLSTGGTAIDRTDEIHPDNARVARDAAMAIGLDVAGIDFVIPDITRSFREVGGGIVEVNAGPGFRMHTHPTKGTARPIGQAVVDMLFPRGRPSRIPILAVTGTNGKTTTTRMIAHIMRAAGRTVGLTTTDAIEIDGDLIATGDMAGPSSAQLVLRHPRVDCAVLETARGGILRSGLGFDRCDVAVVTNVASDHLGLKGIDTLDDLARVKAVLPAAVFRDGTAVLNADNQWTTGMADATQGEVIFFSMREDSPVVREHLRNHGRVVVLADVAGDEVITLIERGARTPVMSARAIPATSGGRIRVNIANAMAATAAAVAQNVPLGVIRAALSGFGNGYDQTPGRFNLLLVEGREVLVDYGHNVEALRAVGEFVRRSAAPATIGVITSPGDRRDIDISDFGALSARIFDRLIIRDGSTLRDRPAGEVAGLLRDAALGAGMPLDRITMMDGDLAAAHAAIDLAAPGDLVHVMTERIPETWESLNARVARSRSPLTNGVVSDRTGMLNAR